MLVWKDFESWQEADEEGARFLKELVLGKPDAHLVLATGASPKGAYANFAQIVQREGIDCTQLRITCLDEWWGLEPYSAGTCAAFLEKFVLEPWNCERSKFLDYHLVASTAEEARDVFAAEFAKRGEVDLCVLGIGVNGHVGLNEPGQGFSTSVHVSELAPSTKSHTMMATHSVRPERGITLGCDDLLRSTSILVFADRDDKRQPLARLRSGEVTPACPCTVLSRHPNATVITASRSPGIPSLAG